MWILKMAILRTNRTEEQVLEAAHKALIGKNFRVQNLSIPYTDEGYQKVSNFRAIVFENEAGKTCHIAEYFIW